MSGKEAKDQHGSEKDGLKEKGKPEPLSITVTPADEDSEKEDYFDGDDQSPSSPDSGLFVAEFDERGGTMSRRGSDVILRVPAGAVPKGEIFRIEGRIDTNLKSYNHLMNSEDEFITGPVPEYKLVGGGTFEKPVEIEIPVCVSNAKGIEDTRVLVEDSENSFKDIEGTNKTDFKEGETTYSFKENKIVIKTDHFTRFVCTYHGEENVTDAILVVYASTTVGVKKTYVKLRVMLHFKCAGQNDFSGERDEFLDPGMGEVVKQKIVLPVSKINHPLISTGFVIHEPEDSQWKLRSEGGDLLTPPNKAIAGDSLCFSGPNHRSEQLADFCLENPITEKPPMLHCHVTMKLINDQEDGQQDIVLAETMIVDYQPQVKVSTNGASAAAARPKDLEDSLINDIAQKLAGENEVVKLGIHLGLAFQTVECLKRPEDDSFTRSYRVLDHWRRQQGVDATRDKLKTALERIGRRDLSEHLI